MMAWFGLVPYNAAQESTAHSLCTPAAAQPLGRRRSVGRMRVAVVAAAQE